MVRVTLCYGHNLGTATGQYGWLRMLFPDFPSGYGQITGKKAVFFPYHVTVGYGYGRLRQITAKMAIFSHIHSAQVTGKEFLKADAAKEA